MVIFGALVNDLQGRNPRRSEATTSKQGGGLRDESPPQGKGRQAARLLAAPISGEPVGARDEAAGPAGDP